MFCTKCGFQLADGQTVCPECGTAIEVEEAAAPAPEAVAEPVAQTVYAEAPAGQPVYTEVPAGQPVYTEVPAGQPVYGQPPVQPAPQQYMPGSEPIVPVEPQKGGKAKFIIIAVILVAVIAGLIFLLIKLIGGAGSKTNASDTTLSYVNADFDEDGNAVFVLENEIVMIKGEFQWGQSTLDQKSFVLIDQDDTLYYYQKASSDKVKIADDVNYVDKFTSEGVIYAVLEKGTVNDVLDKFVEDYNEENSYEMTKQEAKEEFEDYWGGETVEDAIEFYNWYIYDNYLYESDINHYFYYKTTFGSKQETVELEADTTYYYTDYIEDSLACVGITSEDKLIAYKSNSTEKISICSVEEESSILGFTPDLSTILWSSVDDDDLIVYSTVDGEKEKIGVLGENMSYASGSAYFINNYKNYVVFSYSTDRVIIGEVGGEANVVKFSDNIDWVYNDRGDYIWKYPRNGISGIFVVTQGDSQSLYEVGLDGEKEKLKSNVEQVYGVVNNKIIYTNDEDSLYIADLKNHQLENEEKVSNDVESASLSINGKYLFYCKEGDDWNSYDLYYVSPTAKNPEGEKIASDVGTYYRTTKDDQIYYIKDRDEVKDTGYSIGVLYSYTVGGEATKISSDIYMMYYPYVSYYIPASNAYMSKFADTHKNKDYDYEYITYDIGTSGKNGFEKQVEDIGYSF